MNYNDIYFNNLLKEYPNIQDISLNNNTLIYQNKAIPLGRFSLASLFSDPYGDLRNDLLHLNANDLFTIIYIHAMFYQDSEKLLKNFKIVSKNPKEGNLTKYYQDYLYYLLRYQDYLTNGLQDFLNIIVQKVISNEYRDYHTAEELDFTNKFYELKNIADEDKRTWQMKVQKANKLVRTKNTGTMAGFANAFVVILTTLFLAIIIASTLFVLLY